MEYVLIGVGMLLVAIVGGIYLAKKNAVEQQNQLKVMLFVLYFWVLVFVQIILFALGYYIYNKFY